MAFDEPYSAYAEFYDRIGQRAFGERMARAILDELHRRGVHPTSVLDLGCGTGSATLEFARMGLLAVGVDRSPEMLRRAIGYARSAGIDAEFRPGDMREFIVDPPVELVTSIYDAVNYLQDPGEVRAFIQSAFEALVPGGYLVFDLNSRHRLMHPSEHGVLLAHDSSDLFVTYRSWYDERMDASPLILTAFVRTEDGMWERHDEEHIERSWPLGDVTSWTIAAGFRSIDAYGFIDATGRLLSPAREDHGRIVFFARR